MERFVTSSTQSMSDCLVRGPEAGYCGDGVVGEGEECDCGSVEACLARRSLCVPPGAWRGERQCSVRKLVRWGQ